MSQNLFKSDGNQHWISAYSPLIFILIASFLAADLAVLYSRQFLLPTANPVARLPQPLAENFPDRSQYQTVVSRNLFSGDNIIPDPLKGEGTDPLQELPPVPSSLPLGLVGTLVHSNPEKSLAAVEVKGKNQVISYSIKQDMEGVAILEKIERGKIIFRNSGNGRLEYIELPQTGKLAFESGKASTTEGSEIKQVGEGQFELNKADLDKYLSNIAEVAQQAQSVPARRPGTGEVYGFRILSVQPESILAKIVNPMDVITAANGSPVTSIRQAMEMYSALKNSPRVCITIERDGRLKENCYNIK